MKIQIGSAESTVLNCKGGGRHTSAGRSSLTEQLFGNKSEEKVIIIKKKRKEERKLTAAR